MLHSVLSTTGLLTLIEGHRTEPIMTEENTHGFSTRKIILVSRVEYEDEKSIDSMSSETIVERVALGEDDTFDYIHDNDRLFSLVYIMFSKTLHHNISIQNQKLRNGIESYRDMITYILGQRQQDVKFARKALDNYQINPSIHFRLGYSKWEQFFSNLEHAMMINDVVKMAWVSDRVDSDPRPKIASSFAACVVNNTSYNESMGIMLRVADAMPPETAVIRMASITSSPETSGSSEYSLYQNTIQNQSQTKLSQYQALSNPPQNPGTRQTQYNPNHNYDINNKKKIQDARSLPDYTGDNKRPVKNRGYCFGFQKGTCKRPTCKYEHAMNPENENKIPQPQSNTIPYKKSVQFDLTQAQIDSVGPKIGDPSIRGGYSKAQLKRLNWMRSQDTEIEHKVRFISYFLFQNNTTYSISM